MTRPSDPPRREREERITATGWRLVGPAARMVSDAAAAGLARPRREDLLFAANFLLRPRVGTTPVNQALSVLSRAVTKAHPDFRPLDREAGTTDVAGRLHAVHWKVATGAEQWIGELLWRHAHPTVPGVALTTHVVLSEHPGVGRMTLRVGVPGGVSAVFGPVGAGQAHPPFLADLHRLVRLVFDQLDGEPHILGEGDIRTFVSEVLLSESRTHPVAVIAPTEAGDYLVPLAQLAEELLGVAHLYVLDRHPTTFRLTDALGDRRLSCYWGALRAYLPEFSCADPPRRHPLLGAERLVDPVVRAQLRGELALAGRYRVQEPAGVEALTAPHPSGAEPSSPPSASAEHPASPPPVSPVPRLAVAPSPATEAQAGLERRLEEVTRTLDRLAGINAALLDEVTALRTTNAIRRATATGLERRLDDLGRMLREQFGLVQPEEETVESAGGATAAPETTFDEEAEAVTLASVVRQAAISHDNALLVLDEAIRAAEDSPYQDVERAAAVLDAMALVARWRQAGTLGVSLRDAFRELGVDYRRGLSDSTPARLRQQYTARLPNGDVVEATEHIALGASYDPRYCLRIYFTSRAPAEPRFVVAYVGRHREVMSTT